VPRWDHQSRVLVPGIQRGPRRVKIRFKNSRGDTLTVRRRATTRWKYVRLTPLHTGRYWTTFSGPKKGGGKWRATYVTRVRRC
jgi:hypothetical protein